ncbi:hypothetical protein [Clostridium aminobutyricum]|uniref:Uncharacterized protein n=1 Tax=Clostridium aminobutyricum TaxID=33953 RepID=A0A939IGW4_CLOAM|nr:hypothetical protein [Clostridium aminobutyricum]MBN7774040.1 hypothetical protein [Clostridium aminobutyricum]
MKKGLIVTYFVLCFILFGTVESFAYLDPSTSTYIIQLIAGGLIAAGTAIGIYWHKFKKAVTGKKVQSNPPKAESRLDSMEEGKTLTAEDILKMAEERDN